MDDGSWVLWQPVAPDGGPIYGWKRRKRQLKRQEFGPLRRDTRQKVHTSRRLDRADLPRPKRDEEQMTKAEIQTRLRAIKVETGCVDCGFRAHHAALEFDHVRGVKAVSLSQINVRHWSIVEHEIAKCEVVCANCHRIRHATKRGREKQL